MKYSLISVFLVFMGEAVFADSPAMPTPRVTASSGGSSYFVMIPERYRYSDNAPVKEQPPFGRAYKLNEFGDSKLLWEVSGWYAFEVYISNNGKYLVRMGDWAQGHEPSEEDLAVAFYDNGKELKRYSTKDLIKQADKVQATVSHYFWRASDTNYPKLDWNRLFQLKTIDGYLYTFNIKNGEILSTEKP